MDITALYAALLAPLFVLLSIRVISLRRSGKAALGDGGNALLLRRMRVHANFAEYVPMALILLGLCESLNAPNILLHGLGVALVVARIAHAWGMSQQREVFAFRVFGIATTFTVILLGSLACLFLVFTQ